MVRSLFLFLFLFGCSTNSNHVQQCNSLDSCIMAVKLKIMSNLDLEDANYDKPFIITFRLNDDAEIIQEKVIAYSGNANLDLAVKGALKKSSPFVEILGLPPADFKVLQEIKLTVDLAWN